MKKSKLITLALAGTLCLSACASSPVRSIAVQTNNDRLIQAAASEVENRQSLQSVQEEAPKNYVFRYSSEDKRVLISAEADVLIPDADGIAMYQVSCQGFTQEQVTGVYEYLFAGEDTWYAQDNRYETKSKAAAELEEARKELEWVKADTELSPESKENWIKFFQDYIDHAEAYFDSLPDAIERVSTDSKLHTEYTQTPFGEKAYQRLDARTDSGKRMTVYNALDYGAGSGISYSSQTGGKYSANPTGWDKNNPVPYGTDVPFSCTYSYEEAKALADGLFRAAGVDVRLKRTEMVCGVLNRDNSVFPIFSKRSQENDDEYNAYRFCYSRKVDGIPVAVTTSTGIYTDEVPTWVYEEIYVTVDSCGISNVSWEYPVTQGDAVNADVNILSFEEAARIFEETAPILYQGKLAAMDEESGSTCAISLSVDQVELNLMRIRDGSNLTGLYVPTWVFYGTEECGAAGTPKPAISQAPWIILAVNGIDGSIIDVTAGY